MAGRGMLMLLLALALAACARPFSPSARASDGRCGNPTTLVPFPDRGYDAPDGRPWLGALVGPLFFSDFVPDGGVAQIAAYAPGYPTKVIIQPTRKFTRPITLKGQQCGTGTPLHFSIDDGGLLIPLPATPAQFASAGEATASLEPPPTWAPFYGKPDAYGGYFLFTARGLWQITVQQDGATLGTLTVRV